MNGKRVEFANSLRGLAILAVLVSHLTGIFWQDRAALGTMIAADELTIAAIATPWFASLHSSWFNWGQFGVSLFFIISGFVIPFSIASHSRAGFLVARAFRIVPTYMAGFAMSLIAIWLSSQYWGQPFPYSPAEMIVHAVPGFRELAWSPHIDFVVWTLEVEIKFYIVCALAAGWIRDGSKRVLAVPGIIFVLGLIAGMAVPMIGVATPYRLALTISSASSYLIYMFIGTAMYLGWTGRLRSVATVCAVAGLFALFCLVRLTGPFSEQIIPTYAVSVAVFAIAAMFPGAIENNRFLRFFAGISFPLYVIHAVLGYAVMRVLLGLGIGPIVATAAALLPGIGLAMGLHATVEKWSQRRGRSLARERWPLAVSTVEGRA